MSPNASLLSRVRAMIVCAAAVVVVFGGCASTGNPRDPLEPVNRVVYKINDGFDNLLAKPVAGMYRDLVPAPIRTGISNFFANINDVIVALNNLLQGKAPEAINDIGRILVNTTLGVFGVMDVATELGVEKHHEDFGQTLGYWGLGDGPYIVLPILGPSSLRDTAGWVGDIYTWPVTYLDPDRDRNALIALRFISGRADLLEASKILETAALDPYEFVRDAYLQRRRNQVYDGNPPDEDAIENKSKPLTKNAPSPAFPASAVGGHGSIIVTGDSLPTPAELEARGQAALATASTAQLTNIASNESRRKSDVVRVWLPFGH